MGQYDVLVLILTLSVIYDLQFDKVPNALIGIGITAGVIFRLSSSKGTETWILVFDLIFPFVLFFLLFLIRAFGAGDIKLFMMTGLYLGTKSNLRCIGFAFLAAAMIGIVKLLIHKRLLSRFGVLLDYGKKMVESVIYKKSLPLYRIGKHTEEAAKIHFSLPILIGTMLVLATGQA